MKIGLIQMLCEKGAIQANLQRTRTYLMEADAQGIDILCFPEMSITGYADPALYPGAVVGLDGPEMSALLDMTLGRYCTLLAGVIEANPSGKPFITQVIMRDGKILGHYRKLTIKDEEALWFSPGDDIPVFTHGEITFGLAICADIDNEHVFASCAKQGAQIVFELAAPGLYGDQAHRNWQEGFDWWNKKCRDQLSGYAETYGIWIAVATQAGRTVDEDFPGGAYVFAPNGKRLFATPDWHPGSVYLDLDLKSFGINIMTVS